jgi:threonine aldolase
MRAVGEIARTHGLKVHVDGARIFNAAISLGLEASDLAAQADSITFCLSKGLAAPVGSVVCGAPDFITKARRVRKAVGGGMRQAGILAAAGIVALTEMVERLADDHANARKLAEGLAGMKGVFVDPESVRTNIVFLEMTREGLTSESLAKQLDAEGVRVLPTAPKKIRAVANYHATEDDIDYALNVFSRVLK